MKTKRKIIILALTVIFIINIFAYSCAKSNDSSNGDLNCMISVSVLNALKDENKPNLSADKLSILPEDGNILKETQVKFTAGESVADILLRELKSRKIHYDITTTPGTNSIYLTAIGNLYEFDCGSLSGWIFKVNSEILDTSCSDYQVSPDDKIEFVYTCDLGEDAK